MNKVIAVFIAVIVVLAVIFGGARAVGAFQTRDYHNCQVTEKNRSYDSRNDKSNTRVYTENCGVFEVQDSLIRFKFNSGDTYGSIREGKTYNFKATGFRSGIMSSFPNIIEATEVQR